MRRMSNNQWNNGQGQGQGESQGEGQWQPQGDWNPAPQQSAGEWDQSQAPQSQDWNTGQQAQNWNAGAQGQPSATDWNSGQQGQDWHAGAQPQPSAQDWNASQGWNAGATAHQTQGWQDHNQQAGFAPGQGQQQWQPQPPKQKSAFGNVFDFSFKKFALPEAAGTIFLISVIAIGVWWLVDLINVLTIVGGPYGVGAGSVLQILIGGLARSVLYILIVRVLIEGMSALVTRSRAKEAEVQDVPEVEATEPPTA